MNQYNALRAYLDFTEEVGMPMYEAIMAWELWTRYHDFFVD